MSREARGPHKIAPPRGNASLGRPFKVVHLDLNFDAKSRFQCRVFCFSNANEITSSLKSWVVGVTKSLEMKQKIL
jgi:hypothetical protein